MRADDTGRMPIRPPAAPLTDGVVVVRQRKASDVAAIAAASHDAVTMRWLDDEPMDEAAQRDSMARVAAAWRGGRSAPLVIADAGTDAPSGLVNLGFHDDGRTTIAYSVFPERRGQGVAPRAVRLVTEWAFHDLGLAEVILEADAANTASIRVAEKAMFERVDRRTDADGQRTVLVFARRK